MSGQVRVILLPLNDSGKLRIEKFIKLADRAKKPELLSDGSGQIDIEVPSLIMMMGAKNVERFVTTGIMKAADKPLDGEIALEVVVL